MGADLRKAFFDPLVNENPITLQILGLCSALAVTKTLATALVRTNPRMVQSMQDAILRPVQERLRSFQILEPLLRDTKLVLDLTKWILTPKKWKQPSEKFFKTHINID